MMILFFSLLFYFLILKWQWSLWLILPISIFCDLWKMTQLGLSGLKILFILWLFYLFFGFGSRSPNRLKIG